LFLAAQNGDLEMVRILLRWGANVEIQNNVSRTNYLAIQLFPTEAHFCA